MGVKKNPEATYDMAKAHLKRTIKALEIIIKNVNDHPDPYNLTKLEKELKTCEDSFDEVQSTGNAWRSSITGDTETAKNQAKIIMKDIDEQFDYLLETKAKALQARMVASINNPTSPLNSSSGSFGEPRQSCKPNEALKPKI